jgi:hypothetical protein
MGQDKSCGTTQIAEKQPLISCTKIQAALITEAVPRQLLLTKRLSVALISPFAKSFATALPPSAALFKHYIMVTTLNHRFIYGKILSLLFKNVKPKFPKG